MGFFDRSIDRSTGRSTAIPVNGAVEGLEEDERLARIEVENIRLYYIPKRLFKHLILSSFVKFARLLNFIFIRKICRFNIYFYLETIIQTFKVFF